MKCDVVYNNQMFKDRGRQRFELMIRGSGRYTKLDFMNGRGGADTRRFD